MKKVLLLLTSVFISFSSFAQSDFTFGGRAGLNLGIANIDPIDDEVKPLTNFHFGGFGEYALNEKFGIQVGLNFNGRGAKIEHDDHHDEFLIYSLDLPISFVYRNSGFFVGVGPTVGFGLSGKFHSDEDGVHEDLDLEFGSNPGELNPINFGINVMAGYELESGLFVNVGSNINTSNWSNVGGATQNFSIVSFGVGYRFGK